MAQNVFVGEVAARYDASTQERFDPAVIGPTVEVLAELAAGRRALEFAVGTGRVALPLRARGVEVHGIELSTDMVTQLRAKPGGADLPVTIGDMSTTRVDGTFGLVFLVFNTISNLLTQAEQVACFRNAAAHLEPGGLFVVELSVPALRRLPPGESTHAFDVSDGHLGIDTYDLARQLLTSHHWWVEGERALRFASHHRYAWPAELDLMAELAGMHLVHRWAGWHRNPFTGESTEHVSVWATR